MLIYFIILSILLCTGLFCKNDKYIFFAEFVALAFIGCFRDITVGTDLAGSYLLNWGVINMNPESWGFYSEMEPGFMFLMAFFKTYISNDYYMWYGLMFFITILGFTVLIKHFCINPLLGLAIFVSLLYYTSAFNIIRQLFALSLASLPLIKLNDNFNKLSFLLYTVFIIFLTFFFHRTLIILLGPLLLLKFHIFEKKLYGKPMIIVLILSYMVLISIEYFRFILPHFSGLLSIFGNRYVHYMGTYTANEDNFYSVYSALLRTVIAIIIVFNYKKEETNIFFNFFYISFVLSVIINNFLGGLSALFLRVGENLSFFEVILFSNILIQKKRIVRIAIISYALIIFTKAIIKNFSEVVPYSNYLLQ